MMYELGQVHDDLEGACRSFMALINAGYRPNIISYNTLIGALAKNPNATVLLPATSQALGPLQPFSTRSAPGSWSVVNMVADLNGTTGLEAALQGA